MKQKKQHIEYILMCSESTHFQMKDHSSVLINEALSRTIGNYLEISLSSNLRKHFSHIIEYVQVIQDIFFKK